MSQERIEAAARAAAKDEDASNWDDEHEYYRNGWFNRMAVGIEAADAALFSDEAIERAARALWLLWGNHASDWVYTPPEDGAKTYCMEQARAVVAALKGDA